MGMAVERVSVDFVKLHPDAKVPTRGHKTDLCYDMYCVEDEWFKGVDGYKALTMQPGEHHIFHTGIAMALPDGYGVVFRDRGGMGAKKVIHHTAGCLDEGYRGEYLVPLINLSGIPQIIMAGDRIIQMRLEKRIDVDFNEVDKLDKTDRGEGRFASTGD
jgi:dUTP pyrophosphatase